MVKKADEGVRVLLLVWDDATSINNPLLKGGLMMTHDEVRAPDHNNVSMHCSPRTGPLPSSCIYREVSCLAGWGITMTLYAKGGRHGEKYCAGEHHG